MNVNTLSSRGCLTGFLLTVFLAFSAIAHSAATEGSHVVTAGKALTLDLNVNGVTADTRSFLATGGPALETALDLRAVLYDVRIREDLAYVAAGPGGLYIVNLEDRNKPLLQLRHTVGDDARSLSIDGDMVYLGAVGGVYSVDVHDPLNPQTLGYVATEHPVTGLAAADGYVAALTGDGAVHLIDVRQPRQMHVIASQSLPANGHAVVVYRSRIFVATDMDGVIVYSRSAEGLKRTGQYRTTGPALDIAVDDDLAYVAGGKNGLVILNVSDPASITWTGSHQQLGDVRHVRYSHGRVLAENSAGRFYKVDVSQPAMPSVQTTRLITQRVAGYSFDGDTSLMLGPQQLAIYNFAADVPMLSNEDLDFGQGVNFGGQRRVYIQDQTAYVADWFSGIHIYDIHDPHRPALLSSYHTDGSPKGIVVRGNYAYVADDDHGLQIINVHDPRHPVKVSELRTRGLAYIPVLDGDRLYLAGHRGGFQIIDISDVSKPRLLGQHDTSGKTWAIRVRGQYAYVADDDAGLLVFDISDPQNILSVGQFNPGGDAEDVILDGDRAYVAFFDNGVYIVDIRDPGFPKKIAHIQTPGNARGLVLQDRYLYVADWLSGVQVIDVGEAKPAIVGHYDTNGAAWGVAINGPYVYVMDWWGGFVVLDISKATEPTLAATYLRRQPVRQMAARGDVLFVANAGNGLQVFDINNPLNPTWMTGVDLPGPVTNVGLIDDYAYAVFNGDRLAVIDIANPYQAAEVETRRLPLTVERLLVQDHSLVLGQHDRGLYFFSTDDDHALKPEKSAHLNVGWRDFVMIDNRLYVVTDKGSIAVYARAERDKFTLLTESGIGFQKLVVLNDAIVAAKDGELDLVSLTDEGLRLADRLPIAAITAMAVLAEKIQAATDSGELYQIGVQAKRLSILARQHVMSPMQDLLAHQDSLYVSGGQSITAVSPLPVAPVTTRDKDHVEVSLPPDLPAGSYDVGMMSVDGSLSFLRNVIEVKMPVFSRPKVSLDYIEEKLKAIQQGNESAPAP